jgi:phage-related protein
MPAADRPLRAVFFRTDSDTEPVRDWLLDLTREERKTIGADILAVQYAWPVGKPLVDSLGNGLWEIRSRLKDRIARTLFILVNQEIVLLHGFVKKTQKTPAQELDLARKRQSQYLKHNG